ncbi:methyltransferase domain-containing protein [Asanoa sp. NPDC050611]|uniref:methyltransferase domain-containing protein n=1 Tax=Asanoa sp. NPDC050611 TaxID=3157098 RepID=UPI0033E32AFD
MTIAPGFLTALDRFETLPEARRLREHSYDLLRLGPGDQVVDVGCGTGRAVAELADRGAVATGVDHDPAMVEVAWQRHTHGRFRVADALDLPFADGELAGYRSDKVLHDLPDPAGALAEAHRVLTEGGRVVVVDIEWDAIIIAGDDPAAMRQVIHARTDQLNAGFAARQAPALLRAQGFTEISTTAHHEVITTPDLAALFLSRIAGDAPDRLTQPPLLVIPLLMTAATKAKA